MKFARERWVPPRLEQVSDLLAKKIPASFINSDLSAGEKETRFSLLVRQGFKLLYVAPERFSSGAKPNASISSRADRLSLSWMKPTASINGE